MTKAYCYNCGQPATYTYAYPVDEKLQREWEISDSLRAIFNKREGSICVTCGVNIRAQGLAKAILDSGFGLGQKNLIKWVAEANKLNLAVCELNSCHELHSTLSKLKNYKYAEFGTKDQQDIEKLTYKNNSFDLVLHSETLEHVNDPRKAMNECRRVIKKNGLVLFTVPIVWTRRTRRRAKLVNGLRQDILEPSYHGKIAEDYIVYYEYGSDIDKLLGVGVIYSNWENQNYVFYSGEEPGKIGAIAKLKFKYFEKRAEASKVQA